MNCKNVDDAALSALPRFPALRELTTQGVSDDGFRHVGCCEQLEGLWCMHCQDTGDAATEHIAGLSTLRFYYAGETQITDCRLEILGRIQSPESLEFWACHRITNAGVASLAGLPRLRQLSLDGLPHVTPDAMALFPAHARVKYS